MTRLLLLGGTTEASHLARALAEAGVEAIFSYAGRTDHPVAQPLPTRVGGFGGVEGLADYIRAQEVTHLVDATHPFAARMSCNAVMACALTGTRLCAYERPAWQAGPGDDWRQVAGMEEAVDALPDTPARVFLAIGKQHLTAFARRPRHHYLLRLVDPPESPLPLPDAEAVIARGPFTEAGDLALLQRHRISHIVAKNAGGAGAEAKLKAARILRIPVILIERPQLPARTVLGSPADLFDWLGRMGNIAHPTGGS
ncbi:MAG: cobalt-precorrin-6A reductase [Rhodobacteraceae bacterium]|nr:cobalt-precorrin-6A reductase [Paracoccaceae bacterium]